MGIGRKQGETPEAKMGTHAKPGRARPGDSRGGGAEGGAREGGARAKWSGNWWRWRHDSPHMDALNDQDASTAARNNRDSTVVI